MIIGGNGFVGTGIKKIALNIPNIKIISVQRSEIPTKLKNPNIKYIKGDALNPENFQNEINQADIIIHTVGTLIDTSITKFRKPGDKGTYEIMNFLTAKKVGDMANSFKNKKRRFIYLSANQVPFGIFRYLENKIKAENYLKDLDNLNFASVKPGLIFGKQRAITIPIGYLANFWGCIYSFFFKRFENYKFLGFLKYLNPYPAIDLEDLSKCILELSVGKNSTTNGVFYHEDLMKFSKIFNK